MTHIRARCLSVGFANFRRFSDFLAKFPGGCGATLKDHTKGCAICVSICGDMVFRQIDDLRADLGPQTRRVGHKVADPLTSGTKVTHQCGAGAHRSRRPLPASSHLPESPQVLMRVPGLGRGSCCDKGHPNPICSASLSILAFFYPAAARVRTKQNASYPNQCSEPEAHFEPFLTFIRQVSLRQLNYGHIDMDIRKWEMAIHGRSRRKLGPNDFGFDTQRSLDLSLHGIASPARAARLVRLPASRSARRAWGSSAGMNAAASANDWPLPPAWSAGSGSSAPSGSSGRPGSSGRLARASCQL